MEDFNGIKSIWLSEKAGQLPVADEFIVFIRGYKNKRRRIAFLLLGILLACLGVFVAVWFGYKATIWTTQVGKVLIFAALFYAIYYSYTNFQKKRKEQPMDSNSFLFNLKSELNEKKEEKLRILIFLFFMFIAYGFFIYEKASGSLQSLIISYTILTTVVAFFWFIYRPFVNRVHQKSVQKKIAKIEELQKQMN